MNFMNNMFTDYLDAQKKLMEEWKEMTQEATKNQWGSMEEFKDLWKWWDQPNFKAFADYTGSPKEVWDKMTKASEVYYNMYEAYKNFIDQSIQPKEKNMENIVKDWMEKSGKYLEEIYLPFLPNDLAEMWKQTMKLGKNMEKSFSYFYEPWMDNFRPLMDAFMKGIYKDPEGFLDFFEEWQKDYSNTISRILDLPAMGISGQKQEEILKATDRFIKMVSYQMELVARILILANKNTLDVYEEALERVQEGEQPKTMEEFYELWRSSLDKAFDGLFYSDEFSKLLSTYMEAAMDFKIANDKILEMQLSPLPVALKTDINSLYKTVYDLKKEVRSLKKELEEIKGEKQEEKPAKPATRTRKTTTASKTTSTDK